MRLAAGRQWDARGCLLLPPSRCRPLAGGRRRAASLPARGALGCDKAAAMPRRSAEGQGVRANAPPHGTTTASGSAAMRPRAPPRPSSAWLISSRPPAPRPPAAPPQPAARAYAVTPRAVRCTPSGCTSAAPGRAGGSRRRSGVGPAVRPARSPARPLGSASAPTRGASAAQHPRVCEGSAGGGLWVRRTCGRRQARGWAANAQAARRRAAGERGRAPSVRRRSLRRRGAALASSGPAAPSAPARAKPCRVPSQRPPRVSRTAAVTGPSPGSLAGRARTSASATKCGPPAGTPGASAAGASGCAARCTDERKICVACAERRTDPTHSSVYWLTPQRARRAYSRAEEREHSAQVGA